MKMFQVPICAHILRDGWKKEDDMRRERRPILSLTGVALMFLLFAVSSGLAASPTPIQLTYATMWPSNHPYSVGDQRWIEWVEKETKGAIKIKPYWGGTLVSAKESMTEATSGVADIVCISPIYEKAGVDMTRAQTGFYQGSQSGAVQLKIFRSLWDKFPELRNEYKNMKIIALSAVTSLRLMSKTPVRSLPDLKGMRIKTGKELIAPLKHYGAEGVIIPSVETYETLQKGIINAAFQQAQYYKAAKLAEVVKYDINLTSVMGPFPNKAMSLKSWNKLPKEIQKIFEDSGDKWTLFMLEEIEKTDKDAFDMARQAGIVFIELPPSEIHDFNVLTDQEALKSAKELDAKGLPGTKMFQEVKRLIKEYSKK